MRTPALVVASLLTLIAAVGHAQTLADTVSGCLGNAPEQTIDASPTNYRALLPTLQPGDRLRLAAGTYTQGLPITDLHGESGRCIVIEGPATAPRAVFTGRDCCNTVAINDSSYVVVRSLDLDGQGLEVDAVKAESPSLSAHHVTIEDLDIRNHGASQQIVGISTKCPAWNWVIRRNVIVGAGTGLYLGNSDGSAEFVNGLVENNLVRDTIGYNLQIKHQNARSTGLGAPGSGRTVIRRNVFSKAQNASTGGDARPNVLVGHWPLSGAGSTDTYEIYGNVFHDNPVEALFQGEGNVAFYDNLLVNDSDPGYPAVAIQAHEDLPRAIEIFHNTVVVPGEGISVSSGDTNYAQRVRGNLVFAVTPLDGGTQDGNLTAAYASAATSLNAPFAPIGAGLDLFPQVGTASGAPVDATGLDGFRDWDRDFNGSARSLAFRGAYSGEGANPGWTLALERPPDGPPPPPTVIVTSTFVAEGDSGYTRARVPVRLSRASSETVSVPWSTAAGTARPALDYVAAAGTLAFPPGTTSRDIVVRVRGDRRPEDDERFQVRLGTPTAATLVRERAIVVIRDDE